jgi:hypothetical protein
MKRKFAWLMLPVMLCALVWGIKWRIDHPKPTKLDSELRALMSKSPAMEFTYDHGRDKTYRVWLSQNEIAPFADSFMLSPTPIGSSYVAGKNGLINIYFFRKKPSERGSYILNVVIYVDERTGFIYPFPLDGEVQYKSDSVHPATTKRWLELLLNHPRIGPELRARMKF